MASSADDDDDDDLPPLVGENGKVMGAAHAKESDDDDNMPPPVPDGVPAKSNVQAPANSRNEDSDDDGMPPLVADGAPPPSKDEAVSVESVAAHTLAEAHDGEEDDEMPPLVADSTTLPSKAEAVAVEPAAVGTPATAEAPVGEDAPELSADGAEAVLTSAPPEGMSHEDALRATAALQAAAAMETASRPGRDGSGAEPLSAESAMRALLAETKAPKPERKEPDEKTKRMVTAIAKDDFEECEDAIMQGADVTVDCGGGMRALHLSALRGEMFLTELLIAHGADVNMRDLNGNTPLLYTCHFYRQHGRGPQLVSQLLYHKADAHYRVKDGKMAGKSAYDLMEKSSREPNTDESAPRNMCAMLLLAMDGSDSGYEAITKCWMQYKSQNKKLYSVSSKRDNYDYAMKNIKWSTPDNAKNAQAIEPVRLESGAESILEEKFTYLSDYLFNDEGDKVKVYVNFPAAAATALSSKDALQIDFELQAFDLKVRSPSESFRLRIEPLFGTIDADQCKHRVSASSCKVTLTLAKRHKNRPWPGIQKAR